MAIVKGKIETLKRIREVLESHGIHRFASVAEIHTFLRNHEKDKKAILLNEKNNFEEELELKRFEVLQLEEIYKKKLDKVQGYFLAKTEKCKKRYQIHKESQPKDFVDQSDRMLYMIGYKLSEMFFLSVGQFYPAWVVSKSKNRWKNKNEAFENLLQKKSFLIAERSSQKLKEQDRIKEVVDGLKSVIAGAVGENKVVKELRKLSDAHIVFNDFSFSYNKMLVRKDIAKKIFCVQIDHLLISNAGIFILETKNWSKRSIQNINMRSPIQQIIRARGALEFYVSNRENQKNIFKETNHWGKREIPIRNVIVMLNAKPFGEFQFVTIKMIHELLEYLKRFQPVLTDLEVQRLSDYLESIKD